MMCSLSINELPYPANQPQQLVITRIELFVIPALAIDSAGFRICLRATSNHGYGWSELFADETEEPIDLQRWSKLLQPFIGPFPSFSSLKPHTGHIEPDKRAFKMLLTAINQVSHQSGSAAVHSTDTEDTVLRKRAVDYISLG